MGDERAEVERLAKGWIKEMKSWMGFPYHFLRSLCVRAQRPCSGPVFAFGGDLVDADVAPAPGEAFSCASSSAAAFISSTNSFASRNAPCSS